MIAWIDLETTGLEPDHHEIIEIAIVVTRDDLTPVHKWTSKVAPRHIERATPDAISVSGYDAAEWAGAPALEEVMPTVARLMRYNMPAGHNTKFDLGFIAAAARQCGMDPIPMHYHCIDTVSLAWPLLAAGEVDSLSLHTLCRHFDVARPYPHRAAQDIEATLAIARILMHRMTGKL